MVPLRSFIWIIANVYRRMSYDSVVHSIKELEKSKVPLMANIIYVLGLLGRYYGVMGR